MHGFGSKTAILIELKNQTNAKLYELMWKSYNINRQANSTTKLIIRKITLGENIDIAISLVENTSKFLKKLNDNLN